MYAPGLKCLRSISYTTRPRHQQEVDGRDYYFLTEKKFRRLIAKHFFVEWEEVHGYLYGTACTTLKARAKSKQDTFFVIDVKGGLHIKRLFPEAVLIFLLPTCIKELRRRITQRRRESKTVINKRLARMRYEFAQVKKYDYAPVNAQLDDCVEAVRSIIIAEKNRSGRAGRQVNKLISSVKNTENN
jgi:guanylate kinase